MRDKYIFPAVLNYAADGISISFPDIEGCFSCADSDEEAVKMAEEALGLHLYSMEQDGEPIPAPSKGDAIHTEPNERIFLVDVWMPQVRREVKPVYVKKTLTIPADLNEAALSANTNMKISELISHINEFAPFSEAEEWDNCGLIIGSSEREVGRVSIALDATHAELDAAIENGCRTLITHHPIIFPALAMIDTSTFAGSVIEKAIKNDVAIIAVHTNWDKCGLNDALAKKLGLIDAFPFFKKIGVIGSLPKAFNDEEFVEHVKKSWGLSRATFHKSENCPNKKIAGVALCGGAGGDLVADAICSRSDVFITAEVKLHTRLAALHEGVSVLEVDHAEMERASLDELICRLVLSCPTISLCSHIQARARFLV